MELEFAIQPGIDATPIAFDIRDGTPRVIDWQPMIEQIIAGSSARRTAPA